MTVKRNIILTSPHRKGDEVVEAQRMLNGGNRMKRDLLKGPVDGDWGPLSAQATRRAKFLIGFPPNHVNEIYTPLLHSYLTPVEKGGKPLPRHMRLRRNIRMRLERQRANKRDEIIKLAVSQIGVKENPAGTNRVKYTEWYGMVDPWCHPAGTLITMSDGTHKPIEEVSELDTVFTAEGNIGIVSATGERISDEIYEIAYTGGKLLLTGEHPVLTDRGYVEARDLKSSDRIALPVISRNDIDTIHISDLVDEEEFLSRFAKNKQNTAVAQLDRCATEIKLNASTGRLFGLYLAEGSSRNRKTNTSEVKFTFSKDETDLVEFCYETLSQELGAEPHIVDRSHIDSTIDVLIRGRVWYEIFMSLCGTGSSTKQVAATLMNANLDFKLAMLEGWMEGDGYRQRDTLSGVSTSHHLARSMFDIANLFGYVPCLREYTPKAENKKRYWTVSFQDPYRKGGHKRGKMKDGALWRKVRSVTTREWGKPVYNLSVLGDESYIANGVGVHNCAMFMSWLGVKVGLKSFKAGARWAYCPYIEADAAQGRHGLRLTSAGSITEDDIVLALFHFGSGEAKHVGVVEDIDIKGGMVTCIEGNTSSGDGGSQDNGGTVARRTRPLSHVRCFVLVNPGFKD